MGTPGDEALAPLWLDLSGRRVTLVGGGPVAARRARTFLADGARVLVISPELDDDLSALVGQGLVRWVEREYRGPGDLDGAWLVHAATGNLDVDLAVADDADDLQKFCIVASRAVLGSAAVAARTSADTPTGRVQVAVHGGGDPRRSVAVRDAVARLLCTGGADLSPRRDASPSRHVA
ncbi:precorrin-2 dehydrogenase/sirohydrochlorin ferrochelatase family protein [Aestuariimicrobium kwangyangense]|uniref:precorrin-2 dehydrogenase/sirohydrochlorin ferrochelatase family protein n=1 Tax=Aestuariimicrobium kwangyangense TaxID=396389 RepID=UPI0003B507A8|nr:NAD(P)-dependent oxidoreductase [Aestuariimicrobium kwangyangense]